MIGVVLIICSVGVGVGGSAGSLVDCGSGVAGEPVSGRSTSTVVTIPPPMGAPAAGVLVGKFSPPGATKVGNDADRGDKEQARLTTATNRPASGINLYQDFNFILPFDLVDRVTTVPCLYRLPIFYQVTIVLGT